MAQRRKNNQQTNQRLPDDSEDDDDSEEMTMRDMALFKDRENKELRKQIEELTRQVDMAAAASSSTSATSDAYEQSQSVGLQELPDAKQKMVAAFVKNQAWKLVKFVPTNNLFTTSKTLLPQLLLNCHITTEREKHMYTEEAKRVFKDETNMRRHNVKLAIKKKFKSKCFRQTYLETLEKLTYILILSKLPYNHRLVARN